MVAEATAGIEIFAPIVSFFIVIFISFLALSALKMGNIAVKIILSVLIAILFSSFVGTQNFIANVIPGFAVILVCLFLMIVLISFVGKNMEFMTTPVGIIFLIILFLFILGTAFFTFYGDIHDYLPGNTANADNPDAANFVDWFYTARIAGAILFIILAALAAWALLAGVYSYRELYFY